MVATLIRGIASTAPDVALSRLMRSARESYDYDRAAAVGRQTKRWMRLLHATKLPNERVRDEGTWGQGEVTGDLQEAGGGRARYGP